MWPCGNVECMEANENEREECKKCHTKREGRRSGANIKKRQSDIWEKFERKPTNDVSTDIRQNVTHQRANTLPSPHRSSSKILEVPKEKHTYKDKKVTVRRASGFYKVNTSFKSASMYEEDNIDVKVGDEVLLIEKRDEWLWVKHGDNEGWIPDEYVQPIYMDETEEKLTTNLSPVTEETDEIFASSEPEETECQDIRIVMVGKTGSGKSATGNSLLGKRHFESKMIGTSVTKECCPGKTNCNGKRIVVIDTPGLFDTKLEPQQIRENIINCVHMSFPGPHVFLIILQIGRFTGEEIDTLNQLFEIFGEWMANYSIVIFTGLDSIEREDRSIESYIEETGESIQKYIKICGGRYFAVNNIASDDRKENMRVGLIAKIEEMVKQNNGNYFSNEITVNFKHSIDNTVKEVQEEEEETTNDKVNHVKHEFETKLKEIKHEKEVVKQEIDSHTELKNRLTGWRKKTEDSETGSEEASEHDNHTKKNIQLKEEEKEVAEKLDRLQTKHKELENHYEEIKFDQVRSIADVKLDHKKRISVAVKTATEDICQLMKTSGPIVNEIDEKLNEIEIQLEINKRNEQNRTFLIEKQKKLQKQRKKMLSNRSKSLDKVKQNSSSLEKQLRGKGKMCPVM